MHRIESVYASKTQNVLVMESIIVPSLTLSYIISQPCAYSQNILWLGQLQGLLSPILIFA